MDKPVVTIDDAPRCPKCDYVLLGLTEFRCPECGTPFDPEFVEGASLRVHLLPWERPDTGGRISRLAKTLVLASLHPGNFFTSIRMRKERRIRNAGGLVVAYLLVSLCLYITAFLVDHTATLVRMLLGNAQPSEALDTTLRALSITWKTELLLSFSPMSSVALNVLIVAALIRQLFRGKLGLLRTMDICAALGCAVALGASIFAFAQVVYAASGSVSVIAYGATFGQTVALMPLLWFACRNLLSLSRWNTTVMLFVSCLIWCGCYGAVMWLHSSLLLMSLGLL